MFSFGLFANTLPFIILAVTSLVGLSSYHIAQFNKNDEDQSEKCIFDNSTKNSIDNKLAHYKDSIEDSFIENTHSIIKNKAIFLAKNIQKYPPGYIDNLISVQIFNNPFERPPPAC